MSALFVSIASAIGGALASVATSGCFMIFVDEPKMPKSMLEK